MDINAEVVYSAGGNTSKRSNLFFVLDFEVVKKDGTVSKIMMQPNIDQQHEGIVIGAGMRDENYVRNSKMVTGHPIVMSILPMLIQ